MNTNVRLPHRRLGPLVWALSLGLAAASQAVTVHTWVDGDGVRHFADAPPADQVPSSEITVDEGPPLAGLDGDYYSIGNQWQRLRAEREAQAAMELERERIDAARRDGSSAPPPADEQARTRVYPSYYGSPPFYGSPYPTPTEERGPPSPRNAFVNTPPPVWPRER